MLACFQPQSDLAHEHGTTRRVQSPAVPENTAVLLAALSDLGDLLRSARTFRTFVLSNPLEDGLATTPPPPSFLHAGILASLSGQAVSEFPSLVKCLSRFHLSEFTTLQTQVSLGGLGRRGRPGLRFGSEISVHCQWASHLQECHSLTHATYPSHRSSDGPLSATRSPVKGRTTQLSAWHLCYVSA